MIINLLKKWILKNKNKISVSFFFSFSFPLIVRETNKENHSKKYYIIQDFLNNGTQDIDLNAIYIELKTSETDGMVLFDFNFKTKEIYPLSIDKSNIAESNLFKALDKVLALAIKKDNWGNTFGDRFISLLSKNELNLLSEKEIGNWNSIQKKYSNYYTQFQKQNQRWNNIISKHLNFLLKYQVDVTDAFEPLKDITYDRFNENIIRTFICKAVDHDERLSSEYHEHTTDICVYIYLIVKAPENDYLDTLTYNNIHDWLMNNIALIDVNEIMNYLTSISYDNITFNNCIVTTRIIDVNQECFEKQKHADTFNKNAFLLKKNKSVVNDGLDKKSLIKRYNSIFNSQQNLIKDDISKDLPIDFIETCNKIVVALMIELSKKAIYYDYKLLESSTLLFHLCDDYSQYQSLVKSIKLNLDIINEVPEETLISMRDVYYYYYRYIEENVEL